MSQASVIVTGASKGIGRAAALILARMGAAVTLTARSRAALAKVKEEIEARGGRAQILSGDISEPDVIERLVAMAVLQFGGLDAIINNAAMLQPLARIAKSDPLLWQRALQVNLWAPFALTQAALPHLRRSERGGRVINVSSGAAVRATPGWSAYCSTKAGLNMFTAVLAAEEPTITAIALRPGVVDTNMQQSLRDQGFDAMTPELYEHFVDIYQRNELLPPEVPGRVLAVLALYAPHEWSGRFMQWQDAAIQALVDQKFDTNLT